MDVATQLLRVVRGEFRWTELQAGLAEKRGSLEWFFPPANFPPIMPTPRDVARGIKTLATHPKELSEWASFVLAASPLLSLEKLEGSPEGEFLLEALWDIAGGVSLEALDFPRLTAIADG